MTLFRKEVVEATQDRLHGEVVFTQPLSTKLFAGALFVILAIAAIWVSVGTYARIETVPGILVTDIPSAKVIAPQPGVIVELNVVEGQLVDQGEILLVINSDRQTAAGGDVASRGIGAIEARRQLSEAQVVLAGSRASAERSRLTAMIASAEDQAASLGEQIALQEQVVASNQEIFDRVVEVVEQGFVSQVEFERRRQTLLSSQQSLASLQQRRSAHLSDATQARSQLASVNIDAAQGISQIQGNLQSMLSEQARLEGEQSYVIKAPIAGRVTALTTGEGRAAATARPLMVIVPTDAQLQAELYAPTRSIGFVEPGEETRLLYDAFPYQRFGSFEGRVASISRIAVDPRETEIPFPFEEPVYRVRVNLDQQRIEAFGEPAPLQPGMTLQANIVLERQSFLAWILQPLNAVLNRT
ncbi:HlyD family efflux transporter periplasmic adaptor subunit [uncultured Erythrobacter sp.]|uniref:HlyD family secretion protein n=1 Tax=uncultured Erythrobacter sp. TaxID=263913 RepID=UPI0026168230|nr:HlyD family efflux transporter periplasmic adaptor subunit [uncultured Erythrobacter sp.]